MDNEKKSPQGKIEETHHDQTTGMNNKHHQQLASHDINSATQKNNNLGKKKKGSIFSKIFASRNKPDGLSSSIEEIDEFDRRLDDAEDSIKKMSKKIKRGFKQMRKKQDAQEKAIQRHLEDMRSSLTKLTAQLQQFQKISLNKMDDAGGKVSGVNGTITGIRDFLSENTQLQQRFQEGYDFHILKNFVRQIGRTINNLDARINEIEDESEDREYLVDAREDLVELLERNGVELICPTPESDYAGNEKYYEVLKEKVPSESPNQKGGIASVERLGFKYVFNEDQERVLQAAKVKLYE